MRYFLSINRRKLQLAQYVITGWYNCELLDIDCCTASLAHPPFHIMVEIYTNVLHITHRTNGGAISWATYILIDNPVYTQKYLLLDSKLEKIIILPYFHNSTFVRTSWPPRLRKGLGWRWGVLDSCLWGWGWTLVNGLVLLLYAAFFL